MKDKHSNCENCNQQIDNQEKLCEECVAKIKRDLEDLGVEEHADAGTFRVGCYSLISTHLNGALNYLTTKATSQHAAYKEHGDKASRRATFIGRWPSRLSLQEAERFARWGFFYTGHGDMVRCFQCGIGLRGWLADDDPLREHIRYSPNCQLLQNALLYSRTLQMNKVLAVVKQCFHTQSQTEMPSERNIHRLTTDIDEESITTQRNEKHKDKTAGASGLPKIASSSISRPEADQGETGGVSTPKERVRGYVTDDQRVLSYRNWSTNIEQTPEQLARAGFYYTENNIHAMVEENKALKRRIACKVCLRNRVKILFLPCQHLWVCQSCGKELDICPRCDTPVGDKITVVFEPNN